MAGAAALLAVGGIDEEIPGDGSPVVSDAGARAGAGACDSDDVAAAGPAACESGLS